MPYEVTLQDNPAFVERILSMGYDPVAASAVVVKLGYALLFGATGS